MDSIVTMIQTLGFPISVCVFMAFYIKMITDHYRNDIKEITSKYEEAIDKFSKSLEKNTKVLSSLELRLNIVDESGDDLK